jgi:hypothetical protein
VPDTSPFTIEEQIRVPLLIHGKVTTGQEYGEIRATFACHFNKAVPGETNLRKLHNIPS